MNKKNNKMQCWIVGMLMVVILLAVDQYTKYLAVMHLSGHDSIILIPGVFQLEYLENRGAAFGILQNQKWLFVVMSALILTVIVYCYQKLPATRRFVPARGICILLTAGAVGNLIDRIVNGYVVDFFYFSLIDFPIFNVADCYVVVSVILFIILLFFYYTEEDMEYLSFKKNRRNGGEL